jgi:phage shock protein PspC (stress-responsive transcriptional regulator)
MSKLSKCKEKKICGVCCGIADHLGIDRTVVRVGFVLGAIFSASALFWLYLLFAIVMPKPEES